MEEYLQYMKTLRTHINDVEDQAAKVSVEEQTQITTIHTLERDLNSAKSETKRLLEETEEMVKSKGDICSKILDKQKRMASLESDSSNLSQTLELIQQERSNTYAKVLKRSTYYAEVAEDMVSKLEDRKRWLHELYYQISGEVDMQTEKTEDMSSKGCNVASSLGEKKEELLKQLNDAEAKLDNIISVGARVASENNEMKQSIEQIKNEINDLKPELCATEITTLGEEHKALLSEKTGEIEYLQSLQSQLEKLKGISHVVKCACGGEYKVELNHSKSAH